MVRVISRQDLKAKLDRKEQMTLVEALPKQYYDSGHLPGAVQMNYDEVNTKADKLVPNKDTVIVTYCASETCPNSTYAADALIAKGYKNVYKYVGGKKDWIDAGYILEKGQ